MTAEDRIARRRWLAIQGVRLGGVAGAMFGLVLLGRAETLAPRVIGVALVVSAMLVMMIVPASLAHRWRSREP